MKKITLPLALMAGSLLLTSCGGVSTQNLLTGVGQALLENSASNGTAQTVENTTSLIGNLLGSLLESSSTLSQKDLIGTWNYTGADCVFESENLLAKAGGAVAASKIENEMNTQLAKVGIKKGVCKFTFNKDNTYTAVIGNRTVQGTYALDAKNKTIKMTYLAGLATMTPHIVKQGNKLSLLIESDKLLTLVKGVSALSGSTTIRTVSSLLSNYNGMYVGMQLSK